MGVRASKRALWAGAAFLAGLRGRVLTRAEVTADLGPRWIQPAPRARAEEHGVPGRAATLPSRPDVWKTGLRHLTLDEAVPLRVRSLARRDLSRWDPAPSGPADPVSLGTGRALCQGHCGAWDPVSVWRAEKVSQTQGTLGPRASSVAGPRRQRSGTLPHGGLENATADRAAGSGLPGTEGQGPGGGGHQRPPPPWALALGLRVGEHGGRRGHAPTAAGEPRGSRRLGRSGPFRCPCRLRGHSGGVPAAARAPGSRPLAPTPLHAPVPPCLQPQAFRRAATHSPCSK